MRYPIRMKLIIKLFVLTLTCATALSGLPHVSSASSAQPKISWSEGTIEITIPAGTNSSRNIAFTPTRNLGAVTIEPVPSIAGLVSAQPNALPGVAAGQSQPVSLNFSIPANTTLKSYHGTIHLRSGNRTIPQPLKVTINVTEAQEPPDEDDGLPHEEENEMNSPGVVALGGVSETAFNPTSEIVHFEMTGATFSSDPEDAKLFHNSLPVDAGFVQVTPNAVSVSSVLVEGSNEIILVAKDTQGLTVYKEVIVWAGDQTLSGSILDENDQPASGTVITAQLGDDKNVQSVVAGSNGQFSFVNLPARTIILDAVDTGNRLASIATNGGQGFVQLKLSAFNQPSPIDNNDFSLGTDGWNIGNAPVQIIPHVETSGGVDDGGGSGGGEVIDLMPQQMTANKSVQQAQASITEQRQARARALQNRPAPVQSAFKNSVAASDFISLTEDGDMDLQLNTQGEGPQTITRAFEIDPGTNNVTVRYRFITSEVPGGYFGTQYNDYFNVSIRSQAGNGSAVESQSMNGLGLGAFDGGGATDWRETSLPVSEEGDTVQVNLTVANVADGILDSQLVVDVVKEKKLAITKLSLKDIDNTNLGFLSTAAHTYFGGNTRIHGTVTVEGAEDDSLSSLVLEVIQGGGVVATANLAQGAQGTLIKSFGSAKKVEITTSQLLFELPSAQAANVNGTSDGTLTLRARAKSQKGEEVTKDAGSVQLLVRFTGGSRYGGRDAARGGDDWVKPSMREIVDHFGLTYGDFSNMNGGNFPPHSSHRNGNDVDGWFSGYNARNAATATQVIAHLNDTTHGSRISMVFVTFDRVATNTFWNAIKDVNLDNGRRARDVILPVAGHTTHFHWRH